MICRSTKPYPMIKVKSSNRKYADLLLEDYASCTSEDTAIHLYTYQSLILGEENAELADTLKEIAKVEMYHLSLLGKTIKALGVDPAFGIHSGEWLIPWNSSCVSYNKNLEEMLKIDIIREEDAIKNYRKHKAIIDDEYIKALLERIIEDELVHLDIFHYYLQESKRHCK